MKTGLLGEILWMFFDYLRVGKFVDTISQLRSLLHELARLLHDWLKTMVCLGTFCKDLSSHRWLGRLVLRASA